MLWLLSLSSCIIQQGPGHGGYAVVPERARGQISEGKEETQAGNFLSQRPSPCQQSVQQNPCYV